MKKIKVVNDRTGKSWGENTRHAGSEEAMMLWYNTHASKGTFGPGFREAVPKEGLDQYDLSVATNERTIDGVVVVDLRAEYTYQIIDVTADVDIEQEKLKVETNQGFGRDIMLLIKARVNKRGIENSPRVGAFVTYMSDLRNLLDFGFLKEAVALIDRAIATGIPGNLQNFVNVDLLNEVKSKIQAEINRQNLL